MWLKRDSVGARVGFTDYLVPETKDRPVSTVQLGPHQGCCPCPSWTASEGGRCQAPDPRGSVVLLGFQAESWDSVYLQSGPHGNATVTKRSSSWTRYVSGNYLIQEESENVERAFQTPNTRRKNEDEVLLLDLFIFTSWFWTRRMYGDKSGP